MAFPTAENETERLEALLNLRILDSAPEPEFDRLCELGRILFNAPIALVSLLDGNRLRFKAKCGIDLASTPRDDAFCNYTILSDSVFVVQDAAKDPLFATNPLVAGSPSVRFYAGAPLRLKPGIRVGSFCVVDTRPRIFSDREKELLQQLAAMVTIELCRTEQRGRDVRTAEDRYRALVEASTSLFWRASPDGAILDGNGETAYGRRFVEESKGDGWLSFLHPADRGRALEAWRGALASGDTFETEYRMITSGFGNRWMQARAVPIRGPDGSIKEWVGSLTDIHDRREAEIALAKSEERLRLAAEATGLGIWDLNIQKNRREWSGELKSLLGLPSSTKPAKEVFLERVHPADREQIERLFYLDYSGSSNGRYDAEFRIIRADTGQVRWISASGRVFLDDRGNPARTVGAMRDITVRREAEALLRASEARFRNFASTSPDAFICMDETGVINLWNQAAERMFGYTDEVIGRSIDLIVPERTRAARNMALKRALSSASANTQLYRSLELTAQHRDGRQFPVEVSLSMWQAGNRRNFGAVVRDITDRQKHKQHLFKLAHFDQLTGLANRTLLWKELTVVARGRTRATLLLIDLDGFKGVNDRFGHPTGDELLKEVARRLKTLLPGEGILARIGGDEFAVLVPGVGDPLQAGELANEIHRSLGVPFSVAGQQSFIGTSIGIAIKPAETGTADELMVEADLALYEAKAIGRNTTRFFAPYLKQQAHARRALEADLHIAYREHQFEMFYQPQVRLADRKIIGAEALLRWRHPERGLLSPASFLPVLAETSLASAVGDWTIGEACAQAGSWSAAGYPIRMGVNLFAFQFRDGGLSAAVARAISETGLSPHLLELEVTEDTILKHDDAAMHTLSEIRSQGVGVAFDDYGTGFASLSMLKRYPVSKLKIDKGFVQDLQVQSGDAAIVNAVLNLAANFGLGVIAEGIEQERHESILIELGCKEGQGYLYGKPLPADCFVELLSGNQRTQAEYAA